jgi:hypothetical protein
LAAHTKPREDRAVLDDGVRAATDEEAHLREIVLRIRRYLGGLTCVECGGWSSGQAKGWRALLGYDLRQDELARAPAVPLAA